MLSKTFVLPYARPPQALARDLLSQLKLPALARLLARARREEHHHGQHFDACLPHERWLCGHQSDNSPPLAQALMDTLGLPVTAGAWFIVQPVHLHIARDHLVLTDYRRVALDAQEAQAFFSSAQPLFAEQQLELRYGNAHFWFVRAEAWSDFRTCSPDTACGHNIDVWQPAGRAARDWRRLHNEVQMLWHQDPLNHQREARGEPRVNALWLWGMSSTTQTDAGARLLADALGNAGTMTRTDQNPCLIDTLLPLALAEDWAGWLQQMHQLETDYFSPALEQLACGQLDELKIVVSDGLQLDVWSARRSGMRKFWLPPSLSRLAS